MTATLSRLVVLWLVPLLVFACTARAGGFEPLERPAEEYSQLQTVAREWKDAVSRRRTGALVDYALPEAREVVQRDLEDPTTPLYNTLYGMKLSRLFQEKDLETLLIPHPDLKRHGMGTSVCFVDPTTPRPSWPISRETLNAFSREPGTFCIFGFRADGRWYISYEFAHPDNGA